MDPKGNFHRTVRGIPQGSILSPIISNIVLHRFDMYYHNTISKEYNVGTSRKKDPAYRKLIRRKNPDYKKATQVRSSMDRDFRRVKYVRYADDVRILYDGTLSECKKILMRIKQYLKTIDLNLSEEKTIIRRLTDRRNNFLGCLFFLRSRPGSKELPRRLVRIKGKLIKRRVIPRLIFYAPIKQIIISLTKQGLIRRSKSGEFFPVSKPDLIPMDHADILRFYNSKIRGILNYYSFVHNKYSLHGIFQLLYYSCALVLARKYKIRSRSIRAAITKFGVNLACQVNGKTLKFFKPGKKELRYSGKFLIKQEVTELHEIINRS